MTTDEKLVEIHEQVSERLIRCAKAVEGVKNPVAWTTAVRNFLETAKTTRGHQELILAVVTLRKALYDAGDAALLPDQIAGESLEESLKGVF